MNKFSAVMNLHHVFAGIRKKIHSIEWNIPSKFDDIRIKNE